MKLFNKLTAVTSATKIIFIVVLIFSVAIFINSRNSKQVLIETQRQVVHNKVTEEQAVNVVKNLPEVDKYFKNYPDINTFIQAEERGDNYWHVQVAEVVEDTAIGENRTGHTATFNWYKVDKTTGEVKCSFFTYDKSGKMISSTDSENTCY